MDMGFFDQIIKIRMQETLLLGRLLPCDIDDNDQASSTRAMGSCVHRHRTNISGNVSEAMPLCDNIESRARQLPRYNRANTLAYV